MSGLGQCSLWAHCTVLLSRYDSTRSLAVTAPERSYCSDQATLRGTLWQVWKGGSLRGRLIVRRQLLLYGDGG